MVLAATGFLAQVGAVGLEEEGPFVVEFAPGEDAQTAEEQILLCAAGGGVNRLAPQLGQETEFYAVAAVGAAPSNIVSDRAATKAENR
jgi:hypothetical protein